MLAIVGLALEFVIRPDIGANGAETLDDVGNIDAKADDVEDEGGAIEQEVGLAGAEELDEEADEANGDDDVEYAADEGRRLVEKLEMGLEVVQEVIGDGSLRPEEREIVWE